jgi:hypothetical protein
LPFGFGAGGVLPLSGSFVEFSALGASFFGGVLVFPAPSILFGISLGFVYFSGVACF